MNINTNEIDPRELSSIVRQLAEIKDVGSKVTMKEFLRCFPNSDTKMQCLEVVNALLSNRFSLKLKKVGKFIRVPVEDEFELSFTDANIPHETNRFFRLLELLPEITIIIDNTLGPEKRMTGFLLVLNEFSKEPLLAFLAACQATSLEKVVMIVLTHEYLRSDKQTMDAMSLFKFIPKSLYLRFVYYLDNGCCLLEQRLIHKSYERFSGELKFSVDRRLIELLNGVTTDLIE